uniref:Uncharacterized protein n=1 Tax=Schizaphis graminum TaxID=13262 RepID=A0A2S2PAT6_SCHGA
MLVDSMSQISAMTVACATCLGLRPRSWSKLVSGHSSTPVVDVKGVVEYNIRPRFASEPALVIQAWILPSITGDMPRALFPSSIKVRFSTLALAYPYLNVASPMYMLLGADVFSSILDGRQVKILRGFTHCF